MGVGVGVNAGAVVEANQADLALLVGCVLSYYAVVEPGVGSTPRVAAAKSPSASPSVGRGRSSPDVRLGPQPASSNLSSAGSCSFAVVVAVVDVAGNIDR